MWRREGGKSRKNKRSVKQLRKGTKLADLEEKRKNDSDEKEALGGGVLQSQAANAGNLTRWQEDSEGGGGDRERQKHQGGEDNELRAEERTQRGGGSKLLSLQQPPHNPTYGHAVTSFLRIPETSCISYSLEWRRNRTR